MQSPMHSLGERKMQPSTPCSASMEWGGRRLTLAGSARSIFVLRLCLKSTGTPLGAASVAFVTRRSVAGTRALARQSSPIRFTTYPHAVHRNVHHGTAIFWEICRALNEEDQPRITR